MHLCKNIESEYIYAINVIEAANHKSSIDN